ncbi:MAG: hypothetical protein ACSLFQ_20655 [Thermoanaerobaculia bacterium]
MHRRSQRVFLSTPLKARLGALPVAVVDLGLEGAGLEHSGALTVGDRQPLAIDARHPIRITARVRHSQIQQLAGGSAQAVFRTGVEFVSVPDDQAIAIDSVLIDEAKEKIAEWEANLTGTRRGRLPALSRLPSAPHAYEWHHFTKGIWTTRVTRDPNQPLDGFAVCDDEAEEKVRLLRKAYELYDDEDRYMLRMMAQLAITERDHR